jgi:hypothetical protein
MVGWFDTKRPFGDANDIISADDAITAAVITWMRSTMSTAVMLERRRQRDPGP